MSKRLLVVVSLIGLLYISEAADEESWCNERCTQKECKDATIFREDDLIKCQCGRCGIEKGRNECRKYCSQDNCDFAFNEDNGFCQCKSCIGNLDAAQASCDAYCASESCYTPLYNRTSGYCLCENCGSNAAAPTFPPPEEWCNSKCIENNCTEHLVTKENGKTNCRCSKCAADIAAAKAKCDAYCTKSKCEAVYDSPSGSCHCFNCQKYLKERYNCRQYCYGENCATSELDYDTMYCQCRQCEPKKPSILYTQCVEHCTRKQCQMDYDENTGFCQCTGDCQPI